MPRAKPPNKKKQPARTSSDKALSNSIKNELWKLLYPRETTISQEAIAALEEIKVILRLHPFYEQKEDDAARPESILAELRPLLKSARTMLSHLMNLSDEVTGYMVVSRINRRSKIPSANWYWHHQDHTVKFLKRQRPDIKGFIKLLEWTIEYVEQTESFGSRGSKKEALRMTLVGLNWVFKRKFPSDISENETKEARLQFLQSALQALKDLGLTKKSIPTSFRQIRSLSAPLK